ncbi:MAG TPA: hypothetical protein VMB81_04735 [Candidatus Sulfotelmatobacter sp.]|nr:hypothetical protein [Candidatus Sulfotelmatobacter sp.]
MPRYAHNKRPHIGAAWLDEREPARPRVWVAWCLWAALAAVVLLALAIHHA